MTIMSVIQKNNKIEIFYGTEKTCPEMERSDTENRDELS